MSTGLLIFWYAVAYIGWTIGYIYIARTTPHISRRPWISGAVFGTIVWLFMQFALILGHAFPGITVRSCAIGILMNACVYGIPVALLTRGFTTRAA